MAYHKTFEELLMESQLDNDEKLDIFIDDTLLPVVLDKMSHRMYVLTKHRNFDGAKALFNQAMKEVNAWFRHNDNVNKGYKLTYEEPDQHGHVNITFTLALFRTSRICNLSTFVPKCAIFKSTNDYLYQ